MLRLSLKRHTEKAVRATIHAQRIAQKLKESLRGSENEGENPTCILLICNGYFSTSAGEGSLMDTYRKFKNIIGAKYTGSNVKPRDPNADGYSQSRLRTVPFDHAFYHVKKDVDHRTCVLYFHVLFLYTHTQTYFHPKKNYYFQMTILMLFVTRTEDRDQQTLVR